MTGQIAGENNLTDGLQAYLFSRGKDQKVVAWSIDGIERELIMQGPLRKAKIFDALGNPVDIKEDDSGNYYVTIGISPIYITNLKKQKGLKSCFQHIE